jgi:hypothetical protein
MIDRPTGTTTEPVNLVKEFQAIISTFKRYLDEEIDLEAPRDPNRQ